MDTNLKPTTNLCWLTADYFLDCDIEIIKYLSNYYHICWHVILPKTNSRFNESEIIKWENVNLEIKIHRNNFRIRDPRSIVFFFGLFQQIKKEACKMVYLNYTPSPIFTMAAILLLPKKEVIVTAHQGEVHAGFKFKFVFTLTYRLFYSHFTNVNMFSKSEADKFRKTHAKSSLFTIPLALKNFGECKVSQNQDKIEFFNFGTIRPNKDIGLLIKAACSLYEKGIKNFHITIAGECDNWEQYERDIKYPELFHLIIRKIENSEINELFCRYHYLVLPYNIVTQSGPLKIAFNYNIPVIASNLPGFSDEIIDGETGFLFEPGNVADLKRVMLKAITNHSAHYSTMKKRLAEQVNREYSNIEIEKKYISMFEAVLATT